MNNLAIAVGCASKIGPRQKNDDYAACSTQRNLYAVADGIGGAPHGNVASACAANAAVSAYDEDGLLLSAFRMANEAVMQMCEWLASPETGTTLLLLACENSAQGPVAHAAWAGDTMAYLLRGGALSTITNPNRIENTNALTSAVGYTQDVGICEATCCIQPGDRLVLCTDGVWETLGEARLAELLSLCDNAPWLAESIAREASETGHDNATAVVLCIGELNTEESRENGGDAETAARADENAGTDGDGDGDGSKSVVGSSSCGSDRGETRVHDALAFTLTNASAAASMNANAAVRKPAPVPTTPDYPLDLEDEEPTYD